MGNLLSRSTSYEEREKVIQNRYTYNSLYQLIQEEGFFDHSYNYDSLYNRIEEDGSANEINDFNQIIKNANSHFTYDLAGNLTQQKTHDKNIQYEYDIFDRLVRVTQNGEATEYTYDELNRRLTKISPNRIQYFIYQGQNEIGSCDLQGNIQELRILGDGYGAEIGAAVIIELQRKVYIPLHDHNGNVQCLVDLEGNIFETYQYSSYGDEKLDREVILNPWRFSSKRVDHETDFVYFGRRYYNPSTGQWITADPARFTNGFNLYAYVLNNPIGNVDLYGLWAQQTRSTPTIRQDYTFEKNDISHEEYISYENQGKISPAYESSTSFDLSSEGRPNTGANKIMGINGINNPYREAEGNARYLSDLDGGSNVTWVYNSTHGLATDLYECQKNLRYIATDPVRELHKEWDRHFDEYLDGTILQVCHSQGCILVRNALLCYDEKRRQQILVLAIAPAAYIYEETCKQVIHYRANFWRDPIPYFDQAGAIRSRGTIRTLKSHPGVGWFDHTFTSRTYERKLNQKITKFRKNGRQKI